MADLFLAYDSLFAFVGINGLLALSVYATLCCGQLSLANAGFMAIGAYTGALITLRAPGVPFIAALAASALAPALVAVPLGLPVLRLRGVFLAIATVGFGEVVRLFFVNWDYTNGALGLVAIPQRTHLWTIALALALALFVLGRLRGSRDRKSTRLNSSHMSISYAVFCLKKKKNKATILHHLKKKTKTKTFE